MENFIIPPSLGTKENFQPNYFKPNHMIQKAENDGFCANCGSKITKDRFSIVKLKEKSVLYCVNCRMCANSHLLNYRYDLRPFGSGSYLINEYYCDICSRNISLKNRILTCPACKYDVCEECEMKCFNFDIPDV